MSNHVQRQQRMKIFSRLITIFIFASALQTAAPLYGMQSSESQTGWKSWLPAITYTGIAAAITYFTYKMSVRSEAHSIYYSGNGPNKNGCTNFHWAAYTGNVTDVRSFMSAKADINIRDFDSETPLVSAIQNQKTEVANILIDGKADINVHTNTHSTALMYASKNRMSSVVQKLCDNRANLDTQIIDGKDDAEHGKTALMLAVKNNFPDVVAILTQAGAHVSLRDGNNNSAVQIAAWRKHYPIVRQLLTARADVADLENYHTDENIRQICQEPRPVFAGQGRMLGHLADQA